MSPALSEAAQRARSALERLFRAASREQAGVSSRGPAITAGSLASYRALPRLKDKEEFEAVLLHAQAQGAVAIVRERREPNGLIERVDLVDIDRLAQVLGQRTPAAVLEEARHVLAPWLQQEPALCEVLERWALLKNVRASGPEQAQDWADACSVLEYCRAQLDEGLQDIPVRDASARLFKNSKRIEALTPHLDVLLTQSVSSPPRPQEAVLQEIGLFREPQPARLSGLLTVQRERGAFPLDRPYCALPPSTVLGMQSTPSRVLTIENLTTFHVQARALCDSDVLCIYTAGMPSPAWVEMYRRLLASVPAHVPVQHWGDVDEGGFRIAAFLARVVLSMGRTLTPHRMSPSDIAPEQARPAEGATLSRMVQFAQAAGWEELAARIQAAGILAEQEG